MGDAVGDVLSHVVGPRSYRSVLDGKTWIWTDMDRKLQPPRLQSPTRAVIYNGISISLIGLTKSALL